MERKTNNRSRRILPIALAAVMLLTLAPLTATPAYAAAPGTYNAGDIAVINAIIDNNGLNWTKASPADGSYVPDNWDVSWSYTATNKRVTELPISSKSLTGTLDVRGLDALTGLDCSVNSLTALNVSGLTALLGIDCSNNKLTALDLTGLSSLGGFLGTGQNVPITLYGAGPYSANVAMGTGATFDDGALSYNAGTLTSTSTGVTSSSFVSPTGPVNKNLTGTLTLTYNVAQTIAFNANGGSGAPASGTTGTDGRLASLPTLSWAGHRFEGWFTAATVGTQITTATVFNAATTIYAHWSVLVTAADIVGVDSPIAGATPATAITPTAQYTGAVAWNGSPATFTGGQVYTATITLTAKNGYTFEGGFANNGEIAGFAVNDIAPTWVSNSGTALVFTVTFPAAPTPAVPAAPTGFTATPVVGQVVLAWSAGSDGYSPILKYQYSYGVTAGYTQNWTDIPGSGAATATYTVTGLTGGIGYTFEVRAVNLIGDGITSGQQTATPLVTGNMTIGGTTVNDISQNASGTGWTWTASTATLALTSAYTSTNPIAVNCQAADNINLTYTGDVSLTSGSVSTIYCVGNLNITSSGGVLTINYNTYGANYYCAVDVDGKLTVSGSAVINATCNASYYAVAVRGDRGVTVSGGASLTTNVIGMTSSGASGIYAGDGDITISTSGTVTANGDGDGGFALLIGNAGNKLNITNGTVYLTGKPMGFSTFTAPSISGGTVKIDGTQVYLATMTLSGVNSATPIKAISAPASGYGIQRMETDSAGNLWFWLPAGSQTVTLTTSSDTYTGTVNVTTDNTAVATLSVVTVPGAPTIGAATAGDGQATVTFTAPTSNGGSAITGYTVTSTPDGLTATGTSSPITVTGLTNGTAYTFKVTATNAAGTGTASAASNSITPFNDSPPVTTYTITFNANGGSASETSRTITQGAAVGELPSASRSGSYRFDGWFTEISGGYEISRSLIPTSDTTYYAHWTNTGGTTNPTTPPPPAPPSSGGNTTTTPEPEPEPAAPSIPGGSTVTTPAGEPAVPNADGSVTLPGGGTVTNGNTTVTVPENTVIAADGSISFAAGSGEVSLQDRSGHVYAIPDDAVIIFDSSLAVGYYIEINTPFIDVRAEAWYAGDVDFVFSHGIMQGTAEDKFSPDTSTSRGMIVTMLYRLMGKPDVGDGALGIPFSDVAEGKWYTDAVNWAAENGIVMGDNGKFRPDDEITRQDLAVILMRYVKMRGLKLPELREYPGFADAEDASLYAKEAIEALYKAGIINGKDNNRFDPKGKATRAEAAAMLHRFLDAVEKEEE